LSLQIVVWYMHQSCFHGGSFAYSVPFPFLLEVSFYCLSWGWFGDGTLLIAALSYHLQAQTPFAVFGSFSEFVPGWLFFTSGLHRIWLLQSSELGHSLRKL
jgi:hypothetical protein